MKLTREDKESNICTY